MQSNFTKKKPMAKRIKAKAKSAAKVKSLGRPTPYKPEFDKMAYQLALLGHTDAEMAAVFGVTEQTVNNWKHKHPTFFESIKVGKDIADGKVADRLYQRAMGFEHESEEIKVVSTGMGMGSEIVRVPVRKIYPPDTVAAIFWLKNRQPARWRDTKDMRLGGTRTLEEFLIMGDDADATNDDEEDGGADGGKASPDKGTKRRPADQKQA